MKVEAVEAVTSLPDIKEFGKPDARSALAAPRAGLDRGAFETGMKIHVLLVEDEALIAELIGEVLEEAGHVVHSVSNAADALTHLNAGSRVDVLFTDINLAGDMDGDELARKARLSDPDLPVIYASGRWGLLDSLRDLPNAKILPKPYSPARACEAVELLGTPRVETISARHCASEGKLALAL